MKTIKTITFLIAVILLTFTTGCLEDIIVEGNGIPSAESRLTRSFSEVASSGEFVVHITNGNEYDVMVNAESNLLHYIETNVRGNTLHIETRGIHNLRNHLPMEIFVTTPELEGLTLSGSGLITTDYFINETMKLTVSGSGHIETACETGRILSLISGSGTMQIYGFTDNADFFISGSGEIDAADLSVSHCEAKISGSGDMMVNVNQYLRADISGSGNIYYAGYPEIDAHISGSGKLIDQN